MTDIQNHKLANLAHQELKRREQRREILFSDSEKALDLILDAPHQQPSSSLFQTRTSIISCIKSVSMTLPRFWPWPN